jgi:hypothetical protein
MKWILSNAGGRKLFFGFLVLFLGCLALWADKIDGSQWVDLIKYTGGFVTFSIAVEGAAESIGRRGKGHG